MPFFDKYLSSKDVLKKGIKIGETKNLKQFCELINELDEKISAELKVKKDAVLKKLNILE